jgi:hypothetical protein
VCIGGDVNRLFHNEIVRPTPSSRVGPKVPISMDAGPRRVPCPPGRDRCGTLRATASHSR